MLSLEPFTYDQGRSAVQPTRGSHQSASLRLTSLLTRWLAHMSDSLVRVSRRAEWGAHKPMPGARTCRDTPWGAHCRPQSQRWRLHEHFNSPGLGHRHNPHRSMPRVDRQTGFHRSTSDRDTSPAPIRFPPDNFKHSLTLFSKSFSSFPRGTCSLSVSHQYLALDGIYRPIGAAFPNNPTRRQRLVVRQGPGTTGLSPSLAPPSRGLGPGPPLRTLLQTTIRTPKAIDSHDGLFPVRSPLLGESLLVSFPPLIDMLKLSG